MNKLGQIYVEWDIKTEILRYVSACSVARNSNCTMYTLCTGATSGKPWSRLHGLTEWNWCMDANQTLFDGLNRSPPVGQKALVARDLVTITTFYVHFIIIEMQMLVHTYHGVRCTCLSALDIQSTCDWVQLYMKSTHNDTSECKAHSDFIEGASNTQWITSSIAVCIAIYFCSRTKYCDAFVCIIAVCTHWLRAMVIEIHA